MKQSTPIRPTRSHPSQPTVIGGVPVRTHLRAGLAWDDLDDKAKELWGQLTSAVSSAASGITNGITGAANGITSGITGAANKATKKVA